MTRGFRGDESGVGGGKKQRNTCVTLATHMQG